MDYYFRLVQALGDVPGSLATLTLLKSVYTQLSVNSAPGVVGKATSIDDLIDRVGKYKETGRV